MRTTEERMTLISKRTAELKKEIKIKENARKRQAASTGCIAACLVIAVGMGIIMPSLVDTTQSGDVTYTYGAASIISENPAAGYIMIGLLSFALGVFATIAAFRLHRGGSHHNEDENENEERVSSADNINRKR